MSDRVFHSNVVEPDPLYAPPPYRPTSYFTIQEIQDRIREINDDREMTANDYVIPQSDHIILPAHLAERLAQIWPTSIGYDANYNEEIDMQYQIRNATGRTSSNITGSWWVDEDSSTSILWEELRSRSSNLRRRPGFPHIGTSRSTGHFTFETTPRSVPIPSRPTVIEDSDGDGRY